jgi:periplasmic protein TonB
MPAAALPPTFFAKHRIVVIAGAVLAFHALAIWAMQSGLLMRAVELVVPVEVLAQIIEPPKPIPPPPVVPKEPPPPVKQAVVKPTPPVPQKQTPPQILAVETPTPTPAPNAPAPVEIAPAAPILPPSVPVAAVASPAPVPAPTPASGKVVLPMSEGDYLSNPKPPFPAMSKRMGEQGSVKVRIYVGADGLPKKAELQKSSGFERLDKAALDAVMQWRYIPGKRGGVPEDLWMSTTVSFILE